MLLVGSVLDRPPGPKYVSVLPFAELALRPPLPRTATLKRRRDELGDLELALRAPPSAISSSRGPMRMDDELERGVGWLLRAGEALGARLLVLPTPPDLTPGQRSRELLEAYLERLRRDTDTDLVWAPRGPWESEAADALARQLGLTLAFDPAVDPRPSGELVYARLHALGATRSFSDASLEDALDVIESAPYERAYVAIDSDRSFKQAQRMQALRVAT
ncbi:MAG: hypothetical protein OXT09_11420 [Myxococcales bacterium]|nr:hypothetical protein [Myxococcales bacterium]